MSDPLTDDELDAIESAINDLTVFATLERIVAEREAKAAQEAGERIAQAIEAAIQGHREAGHRQVVAAMSPLPDLIREEASRG